MLTVGFAISTWLQTSLREGLAISHFPPRPLLHHPDHSRIRSCGWRGRGRGRVRIPAGWHVRGHGHVYGDICNQVCLFRGLRSGRNENGGR